MSKKIAVCGPSKYQEISSETPIVRALGEGLAEVIGDGELANGGVIGVPFDLCNATRAKNNYCLIKAYTPCINSDEWDDFVKKGLLPERTHFGDIAYFRGEGNIYERALGRIPFLLGGANASLVYLNRHAGNTYVELFSSLGLKIPTFVYSTEKTIENAVRELTSGRKEIYLFSDAGELVRSLEKV